MRWIRTAATGVFVCVVMLSGAVEALASTPIVTRGHFEYELEDPNVGIVHLSCGEVRVEMAGGVRETIHCKTDDRSNPSAIIYSPGHLFGGLYPWYSDFTGDMSRDFLLAGTPSGNLDGWASY